MTRQRVQLTKQKSRHKSKASAEESGDQGRATRASQRGRSVAATAARFLARTEER